MSLICRLVRRSLGDEIKRLGITGSPFCVFVNCNKCWPCTGAGNAQALSAKQKGIHITNPVRTTLYRTAAWPSSRKNIMHGWWFTIPGQRYVASQRGGCTRVYRYVVVRTRLQNQRKIVNFFVLRAFMKKHKKYSMAILCIWLYTECWGDFNSKQLSCQKFLQNPFLGCLWSPWRGKINNSAVESVT